VRDDSQLSKSLDLLVEFVDGCSVLSGHGLDILAVNRESEE